MGKTDALLFTFKYNANINISSELRKSFRHKRLKKNAQTHFKLPACHKWDTYGEANYLYIRNGNFATNEYSSPTKSSRA